MKAMKDQNLRMPISLKTIDRRPHDNLPDGALLDLINLRFSNGALRPVPSKVRITPDPALRVLHRHTISETIYVDWGIYSTFIGYVVYENGVALQQELSYFSCTGDVVFSSLGNSLMMSDRATEKTMVFLYLPDTKTYRTFDGFLPALPVVSYQRIAKNDDDETFYSTGFDHVTDQDEESTMTDDAFKGFAQEMLAKKLKKGYLVGKYLVRTAWELFDGTIVMHTTPSLIYVSMIEGQEHHAAKNWQNIRFTGYRLQYFLHMETSELDAIKTQYKGIIKSFNIYTTNTSPLYERVGWMALPRVNYYTEWYDITVADTYSLNDQIDWINGEVNYFELVKTDLEALSANSWQTPYFRSDVSDISSQVLMTSATLAPHRIYGDSLFSYNQRIFLGNIKNTLFPGNTLKGIMYLAENGMGGPTYEIGLSYDIDTASGVKRVFAGWNSCSLYRQYVVDSATNADIHTADTIGKSDRAWAVNAFVGMMVTINGGTGINQSRIILSNTATTLTVNGNWTIEPQNDSDFYIARPDYYSFTIRDNFGYPDVRAKYVDIWHREGGVIHHLYRLPLKQVYGLGFSWLHPLQELPLDGTGYALVSKLMSDWTEVASIGESASYYDGDRIQATEFSNPFYFPAINSYRVDGFVLGMAINAEALSQGQFGQFPIFAFTSNGIWVLNIGDGDILISSIRNLSGVICTNKRSILRIDGGVVFMSNQGLMVLSGTKPQPVSDQIIGDSSPVSPAEGGLDYDRALNNPNTYQPIVYIDGVNFTTYAEAGEVAYVEVITPNGVEKEIIVSNPAYNYSYVFNINSKSWYRITQVWNNFVHVFPKTYGSKVGPTLDDLTREVTDADRENPILVHAETRPVKIGEDISHKKLQRTLLYGLINMGSEKPFTFFLLGTVDGENYFIQQASQLITPGEKVILGRTGFSCRAFVFVLGGYVYDNTHISGIITDLEKRYNSKLL